ncbi:MAG TPA: zf-HC2 domain-containing protein [Myxococcota bacterium]|nr:zf-HC2 domain-containing protein [Myxococcota bacterium]
MSCRTTRARLSEYLEGDLTERDEGRLRSHLDGCAECSAELRALQRAVRALRELGGAEPERDLAQVVVTRLRAGEGRPPRLRWRSLDGRGGLSWVAPFAVVAGIGAIAWLGGIDPAGQPEALREALLPTVVVASRQPATRQPALRGPATRPAAVSFAPGRARALPPIASCVDGRAAADACAPWYSWFVALALEDGRDFVQELDRLPVAARRPWLQRVSEFARQSGSAHLVSRNLESSRDPRATRMARHFHQGGLVRAGWMGR